MSTFNGGKDSMARIGIISVSSEVSSIIFAEKHVLICSLATNTLLTKYGRSKIVS